jgi:hypothetical protein
MKKIVILLSFLIIGLASLWFYNSLPAPATKPIDSPVAVVDSINQTKPIEIVATSTEPEPINVIPAPVEEAITPTAPVILPTSTASGPVSVPSKIIKMTVPFTAQAPFGEWSDLRQQNACEEVTAIMALRWVNGKSLTALEAKAEIIAISDWEQEKYGFYQDTSARDTMDRIFQE